MDLREVQIIELFHVAFLDALQQRLERGRWILKGGANLRYFFDSQRYSQDIDLDFLGDAPWGVREKVGEVIKSPVLSNLLRVKGLSVGESSEHKQSDTTRRWKIGIAAPGHGELVRTKVEFSSRGADDRFQAEAVPEQIVAPYALRPPILQHYTIAPATEQKIAALAGRTQVQSRDVFDLDLLLRRRGLPQGEIDVDLLTNAAEIALEIPFDAFNDHVLNFLEPDLRDYYDSEERWVQMQTFVAEQLEAAR